MLPHTLFAMPFALTAVVLASYSHSITFGRILLILVAFAAARSSAMAFNRLVDHNIDSKNPRTKKRHLPSGKLSRSQVWMFTTLSSILFVVAAGLLGRLCLILSPVALAVIFLYSYTKYFTSISHLVLGLALAIAPAGAYIAVTGTLNVGVITLAGAVLLWVAGFDIIYSLQDENFDRELGLHSIPSKLGAVKALWLSRVLHLFSVALFAVTGFFFPVSAFFWSSVLVIAIMIFYEHTLVRPNDLSRVNAAFFTVNGAVSVVFFILVLTGRLLN